MKPIDNENGNFEVYSKFYPQNSFPDIGENLNSFNTAHFQFNNNNNKFHSLSEEIEEIAKRKKDRCYLLDEFFRKNKINLEASHLIRISTILGEEKDFETSENILRFCLEKKRDDVEKAYIYLQLAYHVRAKVERDLNKYGSKKREIFRSCISTLKEAEKCLKTLPDSATYLKFSKIQFLREIWREEIELCDELEDWDECFKIFLNFSKIKTLNHGLRFIYGKIFYYRKQYENSSQNFQKAIESIEKEKSQKRFSIYFYFIGKSVLHERKYDQAISFFNNCINFSTNDNLKFKAKLRRSYCYIFKGLFEAAKRDLEDCSHYFQNYEKKMKIKKYNETLEDKKVKRYNFKDPPLDNINNINIINNNNQNFNSQKSIDKRVREIESKYSFFSAEDLEKESNNRKRKREEEKEENNEKKKRKFEMEEELDKIIIEIHSKQVVLFQKLEACQSEKEKVELEKEYDFNLSHINFFRNKFNLF